MDSRGIDRGMVMMTIEPRLPFNKHLLESKFEAYSFNTFCSQCGNRSRGSIADVSEESAYPSLSRCLLCNAINNEVRIGIITWRNHLRVV